MRLSRALLWGAIFLMLFMVLVVMYVTLAVDREALLREALRSSAIQSLHLQMHPPEVEDLPAVARVYREGLEARQKATNPCFPLGDGKYACLPSFVVLGAMKAGTTFLYYYLQKHPSIAKMTKKEVFYFNFQYWRGIQWYASHFIHTPGSKQLMGEGTPFYFNNPYCPERIFQTIPSAKLIILLRDPVERAVSQYYHGLKWLERSHYVDLGITLEELLHEEHAVITTCFHPDRLPEFQGDPMFNSSNWGFYSACKDCKYCFPYKNNIGHISGHPNWGLLTKGHYVDQLKAYHKFFPNHQILILQYEDIDHPEELMRKVEEFLEIPHHQWEKSDWSYVNHNEKPELSPETRKWLREYYEPHNRELTEYLGREFRWQKVGDPLGENKAGGHNKSLDMAQAQGNNFKTYDGPKKVYLNPTPAPPPPGSVAVFSDLFHPEVDETLDFGQTPKNPFPKQIPKPVPLPAQSPKKQDQK